MVFKPTLSIFLPLLLLLTSTPFAHTQSAPCITNCLNTNQSNHGCDPSQRESDYDRCICDTLRSLKPLVECLNKCPQGELVFYADTVPDQCERELFPSLPRDDDDGNDDDADDDNDPDDNGQDDSAGLVRTTTGGQTVTPTPTGQGGNGGGSAGVKGVEVPGGALALVYLGGMVLAGAALV